MSSGWLETADGVRLRYAHVAPASPRAVAVLLSGRNEFIEKYAEVMHELVARNFAVYTLDWRGQGLSSRLLPERQRGYVASFAHYLVDLRTLMSSIKDSGLPLFFFAHSMGGHLALRYMHDFPDAATAAVLTAPMIDMVTRRYPPWLARAIANGATAARLATHYAPGMSDYDRARDLFDGNELTSDRGRFAARLALIDANPHLALGGVTYGWLAAAFKSIDLARRPEFLKRITTPLLVFKAGNDQVASSVAIDEAAALIPYCDVVTLQGSRHEILHESDRIRADLWRHADAFIASQLHLRRSTTQRKSGGVR